MTVMRTQSLPPNSLTLENAGAPSAKLSRGGGAHIATIVAALIVVAVVGGAFWKTIVLGQPISRFYLIAHWDSLLGAFAAGKDLRIDPTGLLQSIPYYTFAAQQFHAHAWPLWNHLNAFGSPFCADLQPSILSPLRIVFDLWPNTYTYNLQIVAEIVFCALTTFAFVKEIGGSRAAAVLAACSYALCPFMLWYAEIQSGVGFLLYPFVFWMFARAARSGKLLDALWAGSASGITLLIGHPEPAFFGTAYAALMMLIVGSKVTGLLRCIRNLFAAAFASICVSAPALFPFVEYLRNSDCYKFGVSESVYLPWKALLANLATPLAGGASPFVGTILAAFAPTAVIRGGAQFGRPLALVLLAAVIPAANLWPFSLVSQHAPFSYLITTYIVPIVLLMLCALGALGFTSSRASSKLALAVLSAMVVAPLVLQTNHFDWSSTSFDFTLPTPTFLAKVWRTTAVASAIFVFIAMIAAISKKRWAMGAAIVSAILLNIFMVASVAKQSLPTTPTFGLPSTEVTTFLARSGERCLATGDHILKPNLNILYGIDDARSMNVMWPKRYLKFITACGASVDQYSQKFYGKLSELLDVASVKYVLAQAPVVCAEEPLTPSRNLSPMRVSDDLRIAGGSLWTDANARALGGTIAFQRPSDKRVVVELADRRGAVLWFSDRFPIKDRLEFSAPCAVPAGASVNVSVRVFDEASQQFTTAARPIASIAMSPIAQLHHFKKIGSFEKQNVSVYQNMGALPRAYLAFSCVPAGSETSAWTALTSSAYNCHRDVIVESAVHRTATNTAIQPVPGIIREPNRTVVAYRSNRNGWLVLTDTFYPGWSATIDGKPCDIVRANYLFRGVYAPAGEHHVVFSFVPMTFFVGLACCGFLCTVLGFAALFTTLKRWNRQ